MKQPKTRLDWYEELCRRLDALKQSAADYADEGEVLPACGVYEFAKKTMVDLRRLANFPNLNTPDVWLGPDGQIGITWESADSDLDLIFSESKVFARLTHNEVQKVLEPSAVPVELTKFAA